MIIQNPQDGNLYRVPDEGVFDADAASTAYLQAVAKLNLDETNAEATITEKVNQAIADQRAAVAMQLAELNAAMALDSSVAATVQPQLDSASKQFPSTVAALTPAQPAQPASPAQPKLS